MIKVMLVDDESKVREAIRHLVPWEQLGIRLIGNCSNAVEALHEMTEEMPDILITDIKMPVMNGIELIGRVKVMYPLIQCVIISGYDDFSLAQAAMAEGVRHYLLKPFMQDEVVDILQKCIAQIERDKREILRYCENRSTIVDKLVWDMQNLSPEDEGDDFETQIRRLMELYGEDRSLLREAAVTLLVKHWPQKDSQKTMDMVEKLYDIHGDLYAYVAQILLEKQRLLSENESYIWKVKRYVDKNFSQSNLSLQYIADEVVNMDSKYVGRKFQQQIGIKFNDYLLKVRVEHAITMLASKSNYKMYEIAECVGLGNNVQYFYQLFKKYTGMTPKEYQESLEITSHKKNT